MGRLAGMRPAYGEALVELGLVDPAIVALSADVQTSDYSYLFGERFPDRFFNVGIAEQCLVDVAVGMAYEGLVPFVNTFAVFLASRALEPVLTHLSYGRANVKLMAGYSGLSPQMEGPTHHAITDLAIMRALPGMTVVSPADPIELQRLLPQVAELPGPVYFRFSRSEVPLVYDDGHNPVIGQSVTVRDGDALAFLAVGTLVSRCLEAAERLAVQGLSARVIDVHTIKPLDVEVVIRAAEETPAIVVAEEHSVIGGLGAAVAETLTDRGIGVPVIRVGIADRFAESGTYYEMLDKFGMSVDAIVAAAHRALATRRERLPARR